MRARNIALALPPVLAIMLSLSSLASAGDDVSEHLKSDYVGKALTLRHFYQGDHLSFQSDGVLIGLADVGPWTVYGQIQVQEITLGDHVLKIFGRRVCLVLGSKAGSSRDVMDSLAESKLPDRDKLADSFRTKGVNILIALKSDKPDSTEISDAMNAVFLTRQESIGDFVPDFWRDYFGQVEGRPRTVHLTAEPLYFVKPPEVSAPRATYSPNPEFSTEARQAKYYGTMTVSLVVDSADNPTDIQITSPLGLGLDERAVASVSTWKFDPAMKDGKPVSVRIVVEVDFHLY
jgi:TonB family protein